MKNILSWSMRRKIRYRLEDMLNWLQWAWMMLIGWGPACDECGNRERLTECRFNPWGKPVGWLCDDHLDGSGFCLGCGLFSAGIESFDFGQYAGYCDNCAAHLEEMDYDYEDEDDYYRYGY